MLLFLASISWTCLTSCSDFESHNNNMKIESLLAKALLCLLPLQACARALGGKPGDYIIAEKRAPLQDIVSRLVGLFISPLTTASGHLGRALSLRSCQAHHLLGRRGSSVSVSRAATRSKRSSKTSGFQYPAYGWMCSRRSRQWDTMVFRSIPHGHSTSLSQVISAPKPSSTGSLSSMQRVKWASTLLL